MQPDDRSKCNERHDQCIFDNILTFIVKQKIP